MKTNLNKVITILIILVLSGCGSTNKKQPSTSKYFNSPIGDFKCKYTSNKFVSDSFGPHGGTVKISDFDVYNRIDVEEFEVKLTSPDNHILKILYYAYLDSNTLPLIKSGVADAKLYYRNLVTSHSRDVLFAIVEMPKSSMKRDGTDALRGMFIFSNGEFMYVFSTIIDYKLNKKSKEEYIRIIKESMDEEFKYCSFPPAK